MSQGIFVFGSNLAGRHGRGSAYEAVKNHGALQGRGIGWAGNSYAIPTKGHNLEILTLEQIRFYVECFNRFAKAMDHWQFNIVDIGCGLAGYKPEQIAPMFVRTPNMNFLGELGKLVK